MGYGRMKRKKEELEKESKVFSKPPGPGTKKGKPSLQFTNGNPHTNTRYQGIDATSSHVVQTLLYIMSI